MAKGNIWAGTPRRIPRPGRDTASGLRDVSVYYIRMGALELEWQSPVRYGKGSGGRTEAVVAQIDREGR